jgi:TonB family protein
VGLTAVLLMAATAASAQDNSLARAKDFYASASYDEALQVLTSLRTRTSTTSESTEVAAYQVFCLVALGRNAEAKTTIEEMVRFDPLYHPPEAETSPRVRALYEDVRRPLLPEIVRTSYAKAKEAFDRKEMPIAAEGFDKVLKLLDEVKATDPGMADLRTLATGFRDFSKAAAAPPPPPPAATPEPAPAPAPTATEVQATPAVITRNQQQQDAQVTYGATDLDVKKPVAINQALPAWRPENPVEERQSYSGAIEILIGEDGKVISVTLVKSIHPRYDAVLLAAARKWEFRPATRNGKAVRYYYGLNVHLGK